MTTNGRGSHPHPFALFVSVALVGAVVALHSGMPQLDRLLSFEDRRIVSCTLLGAMALLCASLGQRAAALAGAIGAAAIAISAMGDALVAPSAFAAAAHAPAVAVLAVAAAVAIQQSTSRGAQRAAAVNCAGLLAFGFGTLALLAASRGLPMSGTVAASVVVTMAFAVAAIGMELQGAGARRALRRMIAPALAVATITTLSACWLFLEWGRLDAIDGLPTLAMALLLSVCTSGAVVLGALLAARRLFLGELSAMHGRVAARRRDAMKRRVGALREARLRYDGLFESVPAPVLLTSTDGAIVAANPAMIRMLGCESETDLTRLNFADFYANSAERRQVLEDWYSSGNDHREGELTLRRPDGLLLSVLYSGRLLRDAAGCVLYQQATFTDITPLRRAEARRRTLEAELRLAQKLESVGRLAAGVAHEINTPMQYVGDNVYFLRGAFESFRSYAAAVREALAAAIGGYRPNALGEIQALEREIELDALLADAGRALERADEGVGSVSRIVAAMKELAHPDQGKRTTTDVNALVETALVVSRHEYKTIAEVETVLGDVPHIAIYKNELCQVLINLIVNAAHAIEIARARDGRAGRIGIATFASAGSVSIAVSDNGCGIPESVRERIFDPFFTTKDVGKGTGQGLAIARATVVDKHGGELRVESAVDVGTTFTIEIPFDGTQIQVPAVEKETKP